MAGVVESARSEALQILSEILDHRCVYYLHKVFGIKISSYRKRQGTSALKLVVFV